MYLVPGWVYLVRGCTWSGGVPSPGGVPGPREVPGPGVGTWSRGGYLVPGGLPGPRGTCPGTPPPVDRILDTRF